MLRICQKNVVLLCDFLGPFPARKNHKAMQREDTQGHRTVSCTAGSLDRCLTQFISSVTLASIAVSFMKTWRCEVSNSSAIPMSVAIAVWRSSRAFFT